MEDDKELEGKKVYLKLRNGRIYSGRVKEVNNNIIKLIDKYGALVYVCEDELYLLEVQE